MVQCIQDMGSEFRAEIAHKTKSNLDSVDAFVMRIRYQSDYNNNKEKKKYVSASLGQKP